MSALIEFQSVCKYYQMGDTTVKAADNISFQIQKGEFVAIVGQSGSGKSTCMNIIGCLDVPTSGTYLLDEQDVGQMNRNQLAEIRKYAGMQDFTDADWDELRAVYLGMCMKIDVQFGKLVEALKEEGIYDDCAIFFLSDHGDFTGDFDLPEKAQNCFEDCLTRVPLLIKPPKNIPLDPGISNSMVELVDFYATAMDLAGVQSPPTHFGHSLRPVLADRSAKVRDYVFCEGGRQPGETHCDEYHRNSKNGKGAPTTTVYWPKMKAQSEDDAHAKGIMMRDERYKYISRTVGKDELYDLQADPQEMTNRIDDESLAPVVVDMQRKMLKWLAATDDIVPFELDERFTPEMLWARVRGLVPPEKEAEVRKMIADGTPFPVLMGYCHSLK